MNTSTGAVPQPAQSDDRDFHDAIVAARAHARRTGTWVAVVYTTPSAPAARFGLVAYPADNHPTAAEIVAADIVAWEVPT